MRKPARPKAGQIFRCAIYTRKSSDDGLEQEFNSLDAQREACEAYVMSQRHAGWITLGNMYDDGGRRGHLGDPRFPEEIEVGDQDAADGGRSDPRTAQAMAFDH